MIMGIISLNGLFSYCIVVVKQDPDKYIKIIKESEFVVIILNRFTDIVFSNIHLRRLNNFSNRNNKVPENVRFTLERII